jgi:molybdopterin/thiamine biosynthesis adenylyltransferase/rhodanese-related sulfurtransferase
MQRFSRQIILPGFGPEAQKKLRQSKVLVIGAGGLGCPALLYLSAAGIGEIGIMDGDSVSESNLNRQVLYGEAQVGMNKAEAAAHHLKSKYSDIQIQCIPEFISPINAAKYIENYDLILDGSDNFSTRYLVNDACVLMGKPLVFGAIYQNEGQVTIFTTKEGAVNYRDIYPDPPQADEIPNCSETGVLGVLPGIIGTMQAAEAIKWLAGYGDVLANKILYYNLLNQQTYTVALQKNERSSQLIPKSLGELALMNYEVLCGNEYGVAWNDAINGLKINPKNVLIDVRQPDELPKLKVFRHLNIPYSDTFPITTEMEEATSIYLFCQTGIRSQKMAKAMKKEMSGKHIYSILGGIESPDAPLN